MIEFAEFLAQVGNLEADGQQVPSAAPRAPYDWQERFAQACLAGAPPRVVGVPTGAGKTTAVDALVWALAAQVSGGGQRGLGVRVVWAIDRRLLVDEVYEHALRLSRRLDLALDDQHDPLHETATSLAELSKGPPLIATRWRGGLAERPRFHSPLQPEVITSTVAQIGSRLLFRGYGVGRRSLSIAAGLAACDTTICLDEAHLAEPFRQTTERIAAMQREEQALLDLPALRLIELTATPRDPDAHAILLSEVDKRQLGPRWNAKKSGSLVAPSGDKDSDRVNALVEECLDLISEDATTLACVVNTVARARRVWSALRAKLGEAADVGLLIGPQRQADRDRFMRGERRDVLFDGASPDKPIVVVATQTFEVGLDVDVSAMVTESASSSSLVQRLGRLNRRGASKGRAVIVRDSGSWLYGKDEDAAWSWLQSRQDRTGAIDASVKALHDDSDRPVPLPRANAPLLTTEVVELLAQTSPMPHRWADPDIESFIKGAESDPTADVEICWRSDLCLDGSDEGVEHAKMLVELVPPDRRELLRLNVLNARSLLAALLDGASSARRAALADVDIEGETTLKIASEPKTANGSPAQYLVIRHDGIHLGAIDADRDGAISPVAVAPGDTLVLPTELGGCDEFGLNPQAATAVDVCPDVDVGADQLPRAIRLTQGALKTAVASHREEGEKATSRRRARIKAVNRACVTAWKEQLRASTRVDHQPVLKELVRVLGTLMPDHPSLSRLTERLEDEGLTLSLRVLGQVESDGTPILEPFEEEEDDDASPTGSPNERDVEAGQEEEESAFEPGWVLLIGDAQAVNAAEQPALPSPSPPTLSAHNAAVRDQLEEYAENLGLAPEVRSSLLLAAAAHDLGKADPRFQDFLYGGRAPLGASPIAKSVFGTKDPRASRIAASVSGLPSGFRHEIESVAIVADAMRRDESLSRDVDPDLVLSCIGGHHGLGLPTPGVQGADGGLTRPFAAKVEGVEGVASGNGMTGWDNGEWLERFWRVVERYGPWRFSYLLGLLILADRTVSERGA
jgi:CRISPR-associated endonuclease/helicase Cas3